MLVNCKLQGTGEFDYEIYKPKPAVGVNYFDDDMAMSAVSIV